MNWVASVRQSRRNDMASDVKLTLARVVLGAVASTAAVRVLRAWMSEMSVYDAPTFIAAATGALGRSTP